MHQPTFWKKRSHPTDPCQDWLPIHEWLMFILVGGYTPLKLNMMGEKKIPPQLLAGMLVTC